MAPSGPGSETHAASRRSRPPSPSPFLVAVSAGLCEFGSIFYNFHLMQTGVRDAGRYLSRVPDLAAAEESAKRPAVTGSILSGQKARVSWWRTEHLQISYRTTANPRDAATGA